MVRTLAGGGSTGTETGNRLGVGSNAMFQSLTDVVISPTGIMYVADPFNVEIKRITPQGIEIYEKYYNV